MDERRAPPPKDGEVYFVGGRQICSLKEAGNSESRLIYYGKPVDVTR